MAAGRKPATAGLDATLRTAARAGLDETLDILLLLQPRQMASGLSRRCTLMWTAAAAPRAWQVRQALRIGGEGSTALQGSQCAVRQKERDERAPLRHTSRSVANRPPEGAC
jgi:hypothetical protein